MEQLKPTFKILKEQLKRINTELQPIQDKKDKIIKSIKILQDVCEHEYIIIGNDSHHDHGECKICGKENLYL